MPLDRRIYKLHLRYNRLVLLWRDPTQTYSNFSGYFPLLAIGKLGQEGDEQLAQIVAKELINQSPNILGWDIAAMIFSQQGTWVPVAIIPLAKHSETIRRVFLKHSISIPLGWGLSPDEFANSKTPAMQLITRIATLVDEPPVELAAESGLEEGEAPPLPAGRVVSLKAGEELRFLFTGSVRIVGAYKNLDVRFELKKSVDVLDRLTLVNPITSTRPTRLDPGTGFTKFEYSLVGDSFISYKLSPKGTPEEDSKFTVTIRAGPNITKPLTVQLAPTPTVGLKEAAWVPGVRSFLSIYREVADGARSVGQKQEVPDLGPIEDALRKEDPFSVAESVDLIRKALLSLKTSNPNVGTLIYVTRFISGDLDSILKAHQERAQRASRIIEDKFQWFDPLSQEEYFPQLAVDFSDVLGILDGPSPDLAHVRRLLEKKREDLQAVKWRPEESPRASAREFYGRKLERINFLNQIERELFGGLEERGEVYARMASAMAQFRQQGELEFQPAVSFNMGVIADLSDSFESAVAVLYLPAGSTVLVNTSMLLKAEQLTGRTASGRGLHLFYVEREQEFSEQINRAIGSFQDVKAVRVLSTRPAGQVRAAVDVGGRDIPVEVRADLGLDELMANLGAVWTEGLTNFIDRVQGSTDYSKFL